MMWVFVESISIAYVESISFAMPELTFTSASIFVRHAPLVLPIGQILATVRTKLSPDLSA